MKKIITAGGLFVMTLSMWSMVHAGNTSESGCVNNNSGGMNCICTGTEEDCKAYLDSVCLNNSLFSTQGGAYVCTGEGPTHHG